MDDANVIPPRLREALKKFDSETGKFIDTFVDSLNSSELQSPIYHYTDDAGLRGFLETGRFWLTDISSLNDPSELTHGYLHAMKIFKDKAESGPPEARLFAKRFAAFEPKVVEASAHYFVCCFSTCGDDLGQWRAYADNGRGYALAFDLKALKDAFTKDNGTLILNNNTFPITYNDAQLVQLHKQNIEKMFDLLSLPHGMGLKEGVINNYMKELSISFAFNSLHPSAFFKHEAYSNEGEYRFLQRYPKNVQVSEMKFRSRSCSLIKYREFDWRLTAAKALKQIVIGPAADQQKAHKFVADCLQSFHTESVEIAYSKIPYRAG